MDAILFPLIVYLGAAVLAVPVAARLGLGSVLGYLLAGVMIGPVLGLVGQETRDLQHVAEFGVVMMLFRSGWNWTRARCGRCGTSCWALAGCRSCSPRPRSPARA